MRQIEREVDRYLTLLRDKIRQRGFTQLDVQAQLGWGRSYISQLVTKQKSLRVEQVLLILKVLGVDPAEFFADLYSSPPARRQVAPGQMSQQQSQIQELRELLRNVIGVLVRKRVVSGEDLRVAVEAADQES